MTILDPQHAPVFEQLLMQMRALMTTIEREQDDKRLATMRTMLGAGRAETPLGGPQIVVIYKFWNGDVRVKGTHWWGLHEVTFDPWAIPLLLNILEGVRL